MTLIDQIHRGKQTMPRRILLYGTHGIGKSTWASMAPSPIFVHTEDGLGDVDCCSLPFAHSFGDVMAGVIELYETDTTFETVVVDTVDWLEALIFAEMCKDKNKANIEDIGYGKGYRYALDYWRTFLDGLAALRRTRQMTIILLSHAKIERFEDPAADPYDRYGPNLHKYASPVVQEWVDEVLFATYEMHTKTVDMGFDKKRTTGKGTGERIVYTTERPSHLAKNRLNLPDTIPLDWREYAKHLPGAPVRPAPVPTKHIEATQSERDSEPETPDTKASTPWST